MDGRCRERQKGERERERGERVESGEERKIERGVDFLRLIANRFFGNGH